MYIDVDALLTDVTYPVDCEEVIESCGDRRIELMMGEETLGDVIERCNAGELRSPAEARDTILSGLSEGAIGRKHYSDRDPPVPGAQWYEPLSL
ncbi:MAG: DUF5789 family protein [Natrialbaceae archaeon]